MSEEENLVKINWDVKSFFHENPQNETMNELFKNAENVEL